MNVDKFVAGSVKSLDEVLRLYSSKEITLTYTPEIKYISRPSFEHRNEVAFTYPTVNLTEKHEKTIELINRIDACGDLGIHYTGMAKECRYDFDDKTIYLFPKSRRIEKGLFKVMLAHEAWHLIEADKGLIDSTPLISEGTATYAAYYIYKHNMNFEQINDMTFLLYYGSVNVIKEYVKNEPNPLIALTNPELREKIQDAFIDYLANALREMLKKPN